MNCVVMQRVAYRLPKTNRLVWAVILAQREGLSLLFIQKQKETDAHTLTIAAENVEERVFEHVSASRFPLEAEDLSGIGGKLYALSEGLSEADLRKLFEAEDLL